MVYPLGARSDRVAALRKAPWISSGVKSGVVLYVFR
jgi:hypothetical protein